MTQVSISYRGPKYMKLYLRLFCLKKNKLREYAFKTH